MRFDQYTIEKRKELWTALSDLFLDTELQDYHLHSIAKTMQNSDYSLDEIHDILMLDVFPNCIWNMRSVAGVWTGFDESWLIKKISLSKHPNMLKRWMDRRSFRLIKDNWETIVCKYKQYQI